MTTLEVINACLATLGEEPLALVTDAHPFKSAATSILDTVHRQQSAKGWAFNTEKLVIVPNVDGHILLPVNTISVVTTSSDYVQRYTKLYDRANGTFVFSKEQTVLLRVLLTYDECPELYAQYVAAETVLRFQTRYDGDTAKGRELRATRDDAKTLAMSQDIRDEQANLLELNPRLRHIKEATRLVRGRLY